jgi:hypothetical protein
LPGSDADMALREEEPVELCPRSIDVVWSGAARRYEARRKDDKPEMAYDRLRRIAIKGRLSWNNKFNRVPRQVPQALTD